jgi:hypothetical protein
MHLTGKQINQHPIGTVNLIFGLKMATPIQKQLMFGKKA